MNKFKITHNKSSVNEIITHLEENSHLFVPKLNNYVDIHKYSLKLYQNSQRIEIYDNEKLISLLAFYESKDEIYISNLSVDSNYLGMDIGNSMINEIINKNKHIVLEVYKKNLKAISFYEKNNFSLISEDKDKFKLIRYAKL